MKFLRSRIENNEIIIYYENEKKNIIEKRHKYNRAAPFSNKKKDKLLNNILIPDNMISDSNIYNEIYNKKFHFNKYFDD